jgi:hypothetical protein
MSKLIIIITLISFTLSSEIYLEHVEYQPNYKSYNLKIGLYIPLLDNNKAINFENEQSYMSFTVPVFSIDIDKFLSASANHPENHIRIDLKSGFNQGSTNDVPFYFDLPVNIVKRIQQKTLKFPVISPLKLKSNLKYLPKDYQERYEKRVKDYIKYYKKKYIPKKMKGFHARVPGLIFNEFSGKHFECQQRSVSDLNDIFEDLSSMEYEEKADYVDSLGQLRRGYRFAEEIGKPKQSSELRILISCSEKKDSRTPFIVNKLKILERARNDFKEKAERFTWKEYLLGKDDLREFYEDFCKHESRSHLVNEFYNSIYALIQLESLFGH